MKVAVTGSGIFQRESFTLRTKLFESQNGRARLDANLKA